MYYFECKFLYVGDPSKFSANIPDEVGYMCLIKSNTDLKDVNLNILKKYYLISELLEEHDCETIRLTKIEETDIDMYPQNIEVLTINKEDI